MRRAFTLLELLCAVAIIAILLALLLPVLEGGFARARRTVCNNHLRNIGVAFSGWAHEHNDLLPMQVPVNQGGTREFAEAAALNPNSSFTFRHFQVLSNDLALAKILRCPSDKQRTHAETFAALDNTNVSYWINVGAAFGRTDSPIAGDRNVRTSGRTEWTFIQFGTSNAVEFSAELHGHRGNVLFGDGHVGLYDGKTLNLAFASSGNSNTGLTTLSLPRPEVDLTSLISPPSMAAEDGSGGGSSGTGTSGTGSDRSRNSGPIGGTTSDAALGKPPTNERESARTLSVPGSANDLVVFTRLDGTVVTSSVPRRVTNAVAVVGGTPTEIKFPANPLLESSQRVAKAATRNTHWLLLLLLAAFVAFELARRRSRRNRRTSVEEEAS